MIVEFLWKLPGMKEGSWVMDQALVFLFLGCERKLVGGAAQPACCQALVRMSPVCVDCVSFPTNPALHVNDLAQRPARGGL